MVIELLLEKVSIPALFVGLLVSYITYVAWTRSKYPPGPWPLPLIGNLHLLSSKLHVDFTNLSNTYGPVFTIWFGQQPTVIVSTLESGKEVTVKKGADFAGRALDSVSMSVMFYNQQNLAARSLDAKAVLMRKIALSVIKSKGSDGLSVASIIEKEIRYLLKAFHQLEGQLFDPRDLVKLFVSNNIMELLYNTRFRDETDPEFVRYNHIGYMNILAFQKSILADFYPIFWYLQRDLRKTVYTASKINLDFVKDRYIEHVNTYNDGTIRDLTDVVIKTRKEQGANTPLSEKLSKLNAMLLLSDIQGGATETTIDMILWALCAVLRYPNIQDKINKELDKVMEQEKVNREERSKDSNHGPETKDFPNVIDLSYRLKLPYLNAFIHEVMRKFPTVPLALLHKTMTDATVGNFTIPNGTALMINIYGIHNDPKLWENPSDFNPDRFLDADGEFDQLKAKKMLTFGAGVRSCIGENLARQELFICMANLFNSFVLSPSSVDEVPGIDDSIFGITLSMKSFKICVASRKK